MYVLPPSREQFVRIRRAFLAACVNCFFQIRRAFLLGAERFSLSWQLWLCFLDCGVCFHGCPGGDAALPFPWTFLVGIIIISLVVGDLPDVFRQLQFSFLLGFDDGVFTNL